MNEKPTYHSFDQAAVEAVKAALRTCSEGDVPDDALGLISALEMDGWGVIRKNDHTSVEMTAQEAATTLLSGFVDPWLGDRTIPGFSDINWQKVYAAMTAEHEENMRITGRCDWPAMLVVALGEIAGEHEEMEI